MAVAGMMAESLEAFATEDSRPMEGDVVLGKQYRLVTMAQFTAVCADSGCSSKEHPGPEFQDAILMVRLHAESGHIGPPIKIMGNATFVSPVSGKLRFEDFADPSISDEQRAKLKCTDLRWKTKKLKDLRLELVP